MEKALIAMSGGVDSSVAAFLVKEQGYDCIGATMKLYQNEDDGIGKSRVCCSLDDVEDARSVACHIGIPYYVFNYSEDFKESVIQYFVDAYEQGSTPNPCIECNRRLKFKRLYQRAQELGCSYLVTGHYARIAYRDGRYCLLKARDESKDQSYVLYSLTQQQLAHTLFPLGALRKTEVRKTAEEQGFFNAGKPDSQDICFLPNGDYAGFICRYTGKRYAQGDFTDRGGTVLGKHKGIIHYTLGQRKGLGVSSRTPLYVTEILPAENRIVLGQNSDLFSTECNAKQMNYILYDTPPKQFRAKARIRYHQREQWATVFPVGKDAVHVRFDEPQRAVTRGQSVVLYDGDYVLGGGIIC